VHPLDAHTFNTDGARMTKYMLVAYDDPKGLADVSPADMQAMIANYMAWTQRIASQGKLVTGEKLVDGRGRFVSKRSGSLEVADGPYTEAREVIGGVWIIQADTEEEALEIAASCPHAEVARLGFYQVDAV
jgi:hypothetical protein